MSTELKHQAERVGHSTINRLALPDTQEERSSAQQGIVRDEKGQEQPADKRRAQHVSRKNLGNDPPGDPKQ